MHYRSSVKRSKSIMVYSVVEYLCFRRGIFFVLHILVLSAFICYTHKATVDRVKHTPLGHLPITVV